MFKSGAAYRQQLIEFVKAAGEEVIARAEDLVGEGGMICDFDLWLRFPQGDIPTIEVTRRHVSTKVISVLQAEKNGE